MFVKKDVRKIPEILDQAKRAPEPPSFKGEDGALKAKEDSTDVQDLTELRLARRPAEFGGTLSVLCQPRNAPALGNLVSLSLYDCQIASLEGIGMLGSPSADSVDASPICPDLLELNVGRNPLTSLPNELSALSGSLTTLWCDDCSIRGPLPDCILRLGKLEVLRMSNNAIDAVPDDIERLKELRVLCLDGNGIAEVPSNISKLRNLESLNLRKNGIERLPEGVPGREMTRLTRLHVSSNKLTALPKTLSECVSLQTIYANGNYIKALPEELASKLIGLKTVNFSTNKIEFLTEDFLARFGKPDVKSGVCEKDATCKVQMDQNPVIERARSLQMSQEKKGTKDLDRLAPMDVCA